MGVHIPDAKLTEQEQISNLFPLLRDYADKLNIIVPDKDRAPESLLDKDQSASISGKANPPSFQYLCEFEPPEVVADEDEVARLPLRATVERTRGSDRDRCADAADVISYSTVLIGTGRPQPEPARRERVCGAVRGRERAGGPV